MLRRRLGIGPRFVSTNLLGHTLLVREGIIRDPPDYDEAWFLALAMHAEVVFDVGANRGKSALLALLCPNVKEVVSVEPNPEALVVAAESLVRNHLSGRARFHLRFRVRRRRLYGTAVDGFSRRGWEHVLRSCKDRRPRRQIARSTDGDARQLNWTGSHARLREGRRGRGLRDSFWRGRSGALRSTRLDFSLKCTRIVNCP